MEESTKKLKKNFTRKESNIKKHFSFWDTLCCRSFIFNPIRKRFILQASKLIDKKLSVEYFLIMSKKFEIMKNIALNEEQKDKFDEMSEIKFKEQLKEFF